MMPTIPGAHCGHGDIQPASAHSRYKDSATHPHAIPPTVHATQHRGRVELLLINGIAAERERRARLIDPFLAKNLHGI
jgi:hypothetical protein